MVTIAKDYDYLKLCFISLKKGKYVVQSMYMYMKFYSIAYATRSVKRLIGSFSYVTEYNTNFPSALH